MAVSSLTRMTVPLASDQSASTQGLLMPKLKYRFRVVFEGFGVATGTSRTELTKQVISAARPNVSFEQILVPIYNSTLKLAGKHAWQDIEIDLRDDAGGNVSKLVGEQLQKQLDFSEQASAAAGIDYKFQTRLDVLDGGNGVSEPIVLETWEIYGCYLKQVNWGDANYGTNEAMTIKMTVTYDNATQYRNGAQTGVGEFVGRAAGSVITG
jgi:hypothetical protein